MIPTFDTKVSLEASARAKQEQSSYVCKRDTIEKQAQAVKQAVRNSGAA